MRDAHHRSRPSKQRAGASCLRVWVRPQASSSSVTRARDAAALLAPKLPLLSKEGSWVRGSPQPLSVAAAGLPGFLRGSFLLGDGGKGLVQAGSARQAAGTRGQADAGGLRALARPLAGTGWRPWGTCGAPRRGGEPGAHRSRSARRADGRRVGPLRRARRKGPDMESTEQASGRASRFGTDSHVCLRIGLVVRVAAAVESTAADSALYKRQAGPWSCF
jgi:hypothetical protein